MIQEVRQRQTASSIQFLWLKDQIEVTVSRMHGHRDGRTTAELLVRALGLPNPHLHQSTINLTSTRARREVEKTLDDQHEANWYDVLEYVCHHTLESMRTGEPVEVLCTEEEIKPPQHLIAPLLPLSQPTVIFGPGGVGKSQLAIALCMTAMLPWQHNPLRLEQPDKSCPALYLDFETERNDILWHLKSIRTGANVDPHFFLHYRRCSTPLADDIERIQQAVLDNSIGLVVVDSVAAACGGDLNAPEVAIRLFNALRSLKVTSILLAHTAKASNGKNATPFGSAFFVNYARSVWEIKKSQESGESSIAVGLFHRKVNMGQLQRPLGLTFDYAQAGTRIRPKDVKDVAEFADHLSDGDRIEIALRDGAMTRKEIAEITGLDYNAVKTVAYRLIQKERLIVMGDKLGLCASNCVGNN